MKKQIISLAFILFFLAPVAVTSQDVPPPPGHEQTDNQEGGRGVPIAVSSFFSMAIPTARLAASKSCLAFWIKIKLFTE